MDPNRPRKAIPLPRVDPDSVKYGGMITNRRGERSKPVPMPTVTGAMPGTIPKDVMRPRGIPNALNNYQGFVSEGSPHTYANYPMTSAGPDAIARQDYERRTNIEPFSWYKGNEGWFTKRPISDKLKTWMGMPVKGEERKESYPGLPDDRAEWNPGENIYPRFLIDQLINNKTITEDDVIDLEAPDGDSWRIIPRGLGRTNKYRKLV